MGAKDLVETVSAALLRSLSNQFKYTPEQFALIAPLCVPQVRWLEEYPTDLIDEGGSDELLVARVLENRADRFLNHTEEKRQPPSKVEQRRYLEALDGHVSAIFDLLAGSNVMDGSTADPFKFYERASKAKGKPYNGWDHRDEILKNLLPLQLFARFRLKTDVEPTDDEKQEEAAKRRKTFRRFCFIADLLAAYQRITGKEPTGTVHGDQHSEAVQFVMFAGNPVLAKARQPMIDAENTKKEILSIKGFWQRGVRPELNYVLPDWGKHNRQFRDEINP